MRLTMFRWLSLAMSPLAAAGLALLLATGAAPARGDSDNSDSNASSSNDSRDSDDDRDSDRNDSQGSDNDRDSQQRSNIHHQAALGVVLYPNSVEIRRVLPDSPAENAGLRRDDDILSVNGRRVNTPEQLRRAVQRGGDDERIKIGVLRDGEHKTLRTQLSSREEVFGDRGFHDEQYGGNEGRSRRQAYSRNPQPYGYNQGGYEDAYGPRNSTRREYGYNQPGYGYQRGSRPAYGEENEYGRRAYNQRGYSDNYQRYEPNFGYPPPGYREEHDRFAEYRRNRRGALGVTLDEESRGPVRINHVYRDGPGDEAGLRPGDEIVAVDGREIRSTEDLLRVLSRKEAGEQVRLAIDRNGREQTIRATLESPNEVFAMEEDERGYRMTRSNLRDERDNYRGFDESSQGRSLNYEYRD